MGWIIGLLIVWIIWRFLSGGARREAIIKDAIHRAYVASTQLNQKWINTPIYWEASERFALDRGVTIHGNNTTPAVNLDMIINGEQISVILMRDMNGTTNVSARRTEDVVKDGKAYIDDLLKSL